MSDKNEFENTFYDTEEDQFYQGSSVDDDDDYDDDDELHDVQSGCCCQHTSDISSNQTDFYFQAGGDIVEEQVHYNWVYPGEGLPQTELFAEPPLNHEQQYRGQGHFHQGQSFKGHQRPGYRRMVFTMHVDIPEDCDIYPEIHWKVIPRYKKIKNNSQTTSVSGSKVRKRSETKSENLVTENLEKARDQISENFLKTLWTSEKIENNEEKFVSLPCELTSDILSENKMSGVEEFSSLPCFDTDRERHAKEKQIKDESEEEQRIDRCILNEEFWNQQGDGRNDIQLENGNNNFQDLDPVISKPPQESGSQTCEIKQRENTGKRVETDAQFINSLTDNSGSYIYNSGQSSYFVQRSNVKVDEINQPLRTDVSNSNFNLPLATQSSEFNHSNYFEFAANQPWPAQSDISRGDQVNEINYDFSYNSLVSSDQTYGGESTFVVERSDDISEQLVSRQTKIEVQTDSENGVNGNHDDCHNSDDDSTDDISSKTYNDSNEKCSDYNPNQINSHYIYKKVNEESDEAISLSTILASLADFEGFEVHDVPPDGNCMFAAVLDQLHISGQLDYSVKSLRQEAVNYLRENPYQEDGTHLESFLQTDTWESYLSRMAVNSVWGDHIILKALTELLGRRIVVMTANPDGQSKTVLEPVYFTFTSLETLYLGHIGDCHFNSLRPKTWEDDWPTKAKISKEKRTLLSWLNITLTKIKTSEVGVQDNGAVRYHRIHSNHSELSEISLYEDKRNEVQDQMEHSEKTKKGQQEMDCSILTDTHCKMEHSKDVTKSFLEMECLIDVTNNNQGVGYPEDITKLNLCDVAESGMQETDGLQLMNHEALNDSKTEETVVIATESGHDTGVTKSKLQETRGTAMKTKQEKEITAVNSGKSVRENGTSNVNLDIAKKTLSVNVQEDNELTKEVMIERMLELKRDMYREIDNSDDNNIEECHGTSIDHTSDDGTYLSLLDIKTVDSVSGIPSPHLSFLLRYILPSGKIFTKDNYQVERTVPDFLRGSIEFIGSKAEGLSFYLLKHHSEFQEKKRSKDVPKLFWNYLKEKVTYPGEQRFNTTGLIAVTDNVHPGYLQLHPVNTTSWQYKFNLKDVEGTLFLNHAKIPSDCQCEFCQTKTKFNFLSENQQTGSTYDIFVGFACPEWPTTTSEWVCRDRPAGWPQPSLMERIMNNGCDVISKPHPKSSNPDIEWMFTFARAEKTLAIEALTEDMKYCFSVFKVLVDYQTRKVKPKLTTNLLKTILFFSCEVISPSLWGENIGGCLIYLLHQLLSCLKRRNIPNYFITENNMIDHFPEDSIKQHIGKLDALRTFPVVMLNFFGEEHNLKTWITRNVVVDIERYKDNKCLERTVYNCFIPTSVEMAKRYVDEKKWDQALECLQQVYQEVLSVDKNPPEYCDFLETIISQERDDYFLFWFGFHAELELGISILSSLLSHVQTVKIGAIASGENPGKFDATPVPESLLSSGRFREISFLNNFSNYLYMTRNNNDECAHYVCCNITKIKAAMLDIIDVSEVTDLQIKKEVNKQNYSKVQSLNKLLCDNLYRLLWCYYYEGKTVQFKNYIEDFQECCEKIGTHDAYRKLSAAWDWLEEDDNTGTTSTNRSGNGHLSKLSKRSPKSEDRMTSRQNTDVHNRMSVLCVMVKGKESRTSYDDVD